MDKNIVENVYQRVSMMKKINQRLDIIIEPGIQTLYDKMIAKFPKLKVMIEEQKHLARTARKRYYHNWKVKNK